MNPEPTTPTTQPEPPFAPASTETPQQQIYNTPTVEEEKKEGENLTQSVSAAMAENALSTSKLSVQSEIATLRRNRGRPKGSKGIKNKIQDYIITYGNKKAGPGRCGPTNIHLVVEAAYRISKGTGVAASRMQQYILDRYFGKPPMQLEVSGLEHLADRIKEARARVMPQPATMNPAA